jgi:hypothetical protein
MQMSYSIVITCFSQQEGASMYENRQTSSILQWDVSALRKLARLTFLLQPHHQVSKSGGEKDPHRETDTETERQICCNFGEFFNQVVSSEQLSCLCGCRPINPACRIVKLFKPRERWWLTVCPKVLGFQRQTNYLTETNTLPHFQWGWCQMCKQEGNVERERDQLQEDETSECKLMHTCTGNWCCCWHKKQ